jgi:hypothetical protein
MPDRPADPIPVKRLDRYVITVGTTRVVADLDQVRRIRAMGVEERARFEHIMGGPR